LFFLGAGKTLLDFIVELTKRSDYLPHTSGLAFNDPSESRDVLFLFSRRH
jgi:hypothetical protein